MRVAIYDPYRTFDTLAQRSSKYFGEVAYINQPLDNKNREALHCRFDVVWYEFCTPEFVSDTHRIKKMAYTVCRLHSYELFTTLPTQAKWDRVERLLVTDPHVVGMLKRHERNIDFPPISVLFNGVDMELFKPDGREREPGSIAVVGFINHKKNLPFAIQCLDSVKSDSYPDYNMYIIGESQDKRYDYYLAHIIDSLGIKGSVHFTGRLPKRELAEFLRNMEFIASFSLFESFGQGIMEGIASGCLPIVHDFPGARERFSEFGPIFKNVGDFQSCLENETYWPNLEERLRRIDKYSINETFLAIEQIAKEIKGDLEDA